jgi:hypothetical protein
MDSGLAPSARRGMTEDDLHQSSVAPSLQAARMSRGS